MHVITLGLQKETEGHLSDLRLLDLQELEYCLLKRRKTHTGIMQTLCKSCTCSHCVSVGTVSTYAHGYHLSRFVRVRFKFITGLHIQQTHLHTVTGNKPERVNKNSTGARCKIKTAELWGTAE